MIIQEFSAKKTQNSEIKDVFLTEKPLKVAFLITTYFA